MTDNNDEHDAFLAGFHQDFLEQSQEDLAFCERQLLEYQRTSDLEALVEFRRVIHSMKGTALTLRLDELGKILQDLESRTEKALREKVFQNFIIDALGELSRVKESLIALQGRLP